MRIRRLPLFFFFRVIYFDYASLKNRMKINVMYYCVNLKIKKSPMNNFPENQCFVVGIHS